MSLPGEANLSPNHEKSMGKRFFFRMDRAVGSTARAKHRYHVEGRSVVSNMPEL